MILWINFLMRPKKRYYHIFKMKEFIKKRLRESINEGNIWYHGTPDVRDLEREGGFTERTISVEYIDNMKAYKRHMNQLQDAKANGNEDRYFKLLNDTSKLIKTTKMKNPIFLTNKYGVAKTYADSSRAFDYQNAKEKILKVNVNCDKSLTINATGDRFRFISLDKVKQGFVNAGIDAEAFDAAFQKFNFHQRTKDGIRTESIAVLGQYFGFDCINVIGVLDSYKG